MNLTESIRQAMHEGVLSWTTVGPIGNQEAILDDGSKFEIKNIAGELTVTFMANGSKKGNPIYHSPMIAPGAMNKAKEAAEKFLGDNAKEEELGSENEWGTDELTNKEKAVTPGQMPKKESTDNMIRDIVKQNASLYRDSEQTRQDKENRSHEKASNITDLRKLLDDPDVDFAIKNYGSVDRYKKMIQNKIDRLQRNEESGEDLKSLQDLLNNPDEKFAIKNYGSIERYKKMIQNKIDRLQKMEAISGAEQITLKPTDKLEVKYGNVFVNGRPFEITDPDESLDWPKLVDSKGTLITWFKGRQDKVSTWSPEEITGYYIDKEALSSESTIEVSEKHVRIMGIIVESSDRAMIEAYLQKHSIVGRENELLAIRNEYRRFSKFNK